MAVPRLARAGAMVTRKSASCPWRRWRRRRGPGFLDGANGATGSRAGRGSRWLAAQTFVRRGMSCLSRARRPGRVPTLERAARGSGRGGRRGTRCALSLICSRYGRPLVARGTGRGASPCPWPPGTVMSPVGGLCCSARTGRGAWMTVLALALGSTTACVEDRRRGRIRAIAGVVPFGDGAVTPFCGVRRALGEALGVDSQPAARSWASMRRGVAASFEVDRGGGVGGLVDLSWIWVGGAASAGPGGRRLGACWDFTASGRRRLGRGRSDPGRAIPEGALLRLSVRAAPREERRWLLLGGGLDAGQGDLGLGDLGAQGCELGGERHVVAGGVGRWREGPGVELAVVAERALEPDSELARHLELVERLVVVALALVDSGVAGAAEVVEELARLRWRATALGQAREAVDLGVAGLEEEPRPAAARGARISPKRRSLVSAAVGSSAKRRSAWVPRSTRRGSW